jgi:hypothetical protein
VSSGHRSVASAYASSSSRARSGCPSTRRPQRLSTVPLNDLRAIAVPHAIADNERVTDPAPVGYVDCPTDLVRRPVRVVDIWGGFGRGLTDRTVRLVHIVEGLIATSVTGALRQIRKLNQGWRAHGTLIFWSIALTTTRRDIDPESADRDRRARVSGPVRSFRRFRGLHSRQTVAWYDSYYGVAPHNDSFGWSAR